MLSRKLLVKRDSFVSEPSNKFLNCGHEIDSIVCVPSSKLLVKVDSFDSVCAGNVGFSTINLSVSVVYRWVSGFMCGFFYYVMHIHGVNYAVLRVRLSVCLPHSFQVRWEYSWKVSLGIIRRKDLKICRQSCSETSSVALLCCVDIEVGTPVKNITVRKGNPNTTVTYRLTGPYLNNRNESLTPNQTVTKSSLTSYRLSIWHRTGCVTKIPWYPPGL